MQTNRGLDVSRTRVKMTAPACAPGRFASLRLETATHRGGCSGCATPVPGAFAIAVGGTCRYRGIGGPCAHRARPMTPAGRDSRTQGCDAPGGVGEMDVEKARSPWRAGGGIVGRCDDRDRAPHSVQTVSTHGSTTPSCPGSSGEQVWGSWRLSTTHACRPTQFRCPPDRLFTGHDSRTCPEAQGNLLGSIEKC